MRRRRSRRRRYLFVMSMRIGILLLAIGVVWFLFIFDGSPKYDGDVKSEAEETEADKGEEVLAEPSPVTIEEKLEWFAGKHDFAVSEYPQELIELLQKNAETEEFVLNYPLKKNKYDTDFQVDLEGDAIPLLMQWDSRWGYYKYGDNVMGLTGCGPTCLSMVASYLLQNPKLTPIYMADYAIRNGYCVSGNGTSWDFMSKGAESLGLNVKEVPLNEKTVKRYLEEGHPVICIMGPGEFTDNGHFLVLTGMRNGKITMNDPNSKAHSEKLWEFEDIKDQIRNMWVYLNDV